MHLHIVDGIDNDNVDNDLVSREIMWANDCSNKCNEKMVNDEYGDDDEGDGEDGDGDGEFGDGDGEDRGNLMPSFRGCEVSERRRQSPRSCFICIARPLLGYEIMPF